MTCPFALTSVVDVAMGVAMGIAMDIAMAAPLAMQDRGHMNGDNAHGACPAERAAGGRVPRMFRLDERCLVSNYC